MERAEGDADFRLEAFQVAMKRLDDKGKDRAQDVLMLLTAKNLSQLLPEREHVAGESE